MALRRILLPVDFSEASEHAARYGAALADRCGASLTFCHVLTPGHDEPYRLTGFLPEITAGRVELHGDPAHEILAQAGLLQAGLIAMATHGHGAFRRFLLGSVAAKVLHDAPCPVLTTTHGEEKPAFDGMGAILCAVDLGPASEAVIRFAGDLAKSLGAEVSVIHVLPPETLGGVSYYDPEKWIGVSASKLRQLCADANVEAHMMVRTGHLAAVLNAAAELRAGLLVIGRHPDGGVVGRLRDQAYTVIRESSVPVVSV